MIKKKSTFTEDNERWKQFSMKTSVSKSYTMHKYGQRLQTGKRCMLAGDVVFKEEKIQMAKHHFDQHAHKPTELCKQRSCIWSSQDRIAVKKAHGPTSSGDPAQDDAIAW